MYRNPIVTAITSLGLEHQNVLGNTLEEITMAKAGIMKPAVPCFTLNTHPPHILRLLQERAAAVKVSSELIPLEFKCLLKFLLQCPLFVVPPLESYEKLPTMKMDDGRVTRMNASIAIQLATAFVHHKYPELLKGVYSIGSPFQLLSWHLTGLSNCFWSGRFQVTILNS